MVKVKTSIYADKDLWEKYKLSVARRGLEVSEALEDFIREELIEEFLDEALKGADKAKSYEIDFETAKPKEGL